MIKLKTYKYILGQIQLLTLFLLINNGCYNQTDNKGEVLNYSSIQFNNELIMFQTDDKFGEWGGDTYYLKMYRNNKSNQLMIDYTEYQGKAGPPDPPEPNSKEPINWFTGQPIQFKRKNIVVTNQLLKLISNSIQELTAARINNDEYVTMSGISNQVMYRDSTLLINDYPSISWDKFHKLIKEIKKE